MIPLKKAINQHFRILVDLKTFAEKGKNRTLSAESTVDFISNNSYFNFFTKLAKFTGIWYNKKQTEIFLSYEIHMGCRQLQLNNYFTFIEPEDNPQNGFRFVGNDNAENIFPREYRSFKFIKEEFSGEQFD